MMIPYNEYVFHEHRKDLLRSAAQARLARQALAKRQPRLAERFGWLLLSWGARYAANGTSECKRVENRAGQVVTVCPA